MDRPSTIISDLHISTGRDQFHSAGKVALLRSLVAAMPCPSDLIINGDGWDFLVTPPYELSREAALAKALAIVAERRETMEILGSHALRPGNRLIVIPGNHDAELYYREVWEVICRALGGQAILAHPNHEAPGLLVEHGDQADSFNAVSWADGEIVYPRGSRFVIDHVVPLRQECPWVELVPTRVVPPLLGLVRTQALVAPHFVLRVLGMLPDANPATDDTARHALARGKPWTIYGHTHTACLARGYCNSGAWADRLELPVSNDPEVVDAWIARLRAGTFQRTCSPTYVMVEHDVVTLGRMTTSGPEILAFLPRG